EGRQGRDRVTLGLHREGEAGADRLAVEQDGAGPAAPFAASVPDLTEAEAVTQHVEQQVAGRHPGVAGDAVDLEGDVRSGHGVAPLMLCSPLMLPLPRRARGRSP